MGKKKDKKENKQEETSVKQRYICKNKDQPTTPQKSSQASKTASKNSTVQHESSSQQKNDDREISLKRKDKIEPNEVVNYQTAHDKYMLPLFMQELPLVADVEAKWTNIAKTDAVNIRTQIALIRKFFYDFVFS